MPKTHESDLEQHVLKHLKGLGYAYKPGESLDLVVAPNKCKLRDTLLPKLLSGELRIKDAEKFLEATT